MILIEKIPYPNFTIYESKLIKRQNKRYLHEIHPLVKSNHTFFNTIAQFRLLNDLVELVKNSEIIDFKCLENNKVVHRHQILSMKQIQVSLKALLSF